MDFATWRNRTPAQKDADRRAYDRNREAELAALRKGDLCPECGETENIDDNGAKGDDQTFHCCECNCQWDTLIGREG